MPRMIPSRPDADCAASERRVFERFEQALPAHWTVLHARTIVVPATTKNPATTCEIDFLVIDPARGIVALEVKGGGVRRDSDDLWYSIDAAGDAHKIQNPQKQVARSTYALRDWLRQQPAFANVYLPIGWGVILPDVKLTGDLGPELPRELVIDQHDLQDAASAVDRILAQCSERGPAGLDPGQHKHLVHLLAPTMNLVPLLGERNADDEARLVRMTEDQHRIFDFLGGARRLQIEGPAGSGKTLVAMERARREAAAGKRVLFLCFNALLADWLRNSAKIAGARGITILTFHDLAKKLSKEAGLPFAVPDDAKPKQAFWEAEAPELLMRAADLLPEERWDSVVVDEGQDFREFWWMAIEKLLRSPDASLWVFHDPNQDIYGADALASLKMQPATLPVNCRNTVRIAQHAFAEVGIEPKLAAGAPDGLAVETIRCADESAMKDAVRTALHRLTQEQKLDPARITILTATAADRSILKNATLANLKLVSWPATNKNEVGYCSLQRFKGLESDAVIVCEIDRTRSNATPKHLYVAQSRAKHVLVVAEYGRETESASLTTPQGA